MKVHIELQTILASSLVAASIWAFTGDLKFEQFNYVIIYLNKEKIKLAFVNKFVILFLLCAALSNAWGQRYLPIRAAFGGGISNGVLLYFEPSILIADRVSVGYRSEGGAFLGVGSGSLFGLVGYRVTSHGGVAQYYFFEKKDFRLFGGGGIADYIYHQASNYAWGDGTNTGFFLRVGGDYKHLTFCFDINFAGKFEVTNWPPHSNATTTTMNANYLAIRGGFVIGGGKLKGEQKTTTSFESK